MAYHYKKHINEFENDPLMGTDKNGLTDYVQKKLLNDVSPERKINFETELNDIKNLPTDQQRHATEQLIMKIKVEKYFVEHAALIFQQNNFIGSGYGQSGVLKTSYARSFGGRLHVGFTSGTGDNMRRNTHFTKES